MYYHRYSLYVYQYLHYIFGGIILGTHMCTRVTSSCWIDSFIIVNVRGFVLMSILSLVRGFVLMSTLSDMIINIPDFFHLHEISFIHPFSLMFGLKWVFGRQHLCGPYFYHSLSHPMSLVIFKSNRE